MTSASRDGDDVVEVRDLSGCGVRTEVVPGSELAPTVVSPAPDCSVTRNRETEFLPRRDSHHACRQSGNLDRIRMRIKILGTSVWSQRTVEVIAPGPNRPVLFQSKTKFRASVNASHVCKTGDLHGSVPGGRCAIAELAHRIRAYGPYCFVCLQHEQVSTASGNSGHVIDSVEFHWRRVVCSKVI